MLVKHRMTPDPVSVAADATLRDALRVMRARRIRHLPVLEGGEVVGMISDRDLRLAMPSPLGMESAEDVAAAESTPVGDIMTRGAITVGPFDTVEDAAVRMRRQRVGSLPVVDAAGKLLGILTETDILQAFVEILTASGPSSRLEISLPDRPGELGRAMRIVGEELGINVNSVMVTGRDGAGKKTAVVHLSTIDPREAIAALERAGVEVGWPSLENDLRRMEGA
ncbi:MAG TPA: CBS and ACT domain-containing protein [Longimicrobium sp.]|jgi:acetoin utilization protein AcuB